MKVKPKIVINVSTDKAAESSTLYGTTKNLGEKLTSWAGNHLPNSKFASVRFGNVIETRGNVFEVWDEEMKKDKPLSLTHPDMKRYFFSVEEAVNFILKSFPIADKGEIFVPKMKSYHIKELADKVSPKHKIIGLRPGEKMTEILLTQDEKNNSSERKEMWIIKKKKI
jgi:UDP-N-acetylglucosamine 4,6-dehydratase